MRAPWPILHVAIKPKSAGDSARLAHALAAYQQEDADLDVVNDPALGLTILGGMSEAQLDALVTRLIRDHHLDVRIGAPQVAYRETLTCRVEKDYTHKKRGFGGYEFARIKIVFEPNASGAGNRFVSKVVGGAVPEAYLPGVERGVDAVTSAGVLAGFPLLDVKATLVDGAYHATDSSAGTFEIAARNAFREALAEGRSVVLEPIMSVEINAPADYAGALLGDLRARRGTVRHQRRHDDFIMVTGFVPFANMFGYTAQLRALTQAHGTFVMNYARYEPVPPPDGGRPPPAVAAALRA